MARSTLTLQMRSALWEVAGVPWYQQPTDLRVTPTRMHLRALDRRGLIGPLIGGVYGYGLTNTGRAWIREQCYAAHIMASGANGAAGCPEDLTEGN